MAALPDVLRFHQHGRTVTFQPDGCARAPQGIAMRHMAEACLAAGASAVHVDLGRCVYMDSTFIGTLLVLKRAVGRLPQGEFALSSPGPDCRQLLEQMGLEGVFPLLPPEDIPANCWAEVGPGPRDMPAFKRSVVQAHQELATVPGASGDKFRAVVECLAQAGEGAKPE